MNTELLKEIKRINNMMGVSTPIKILKESGGKGLLGVIDETIGWQNVAKFFDDIFEATERKSAAEMADIMKHRLDNQIQNSYDQLKNEAKQNLQKYINNIKSALSQGNEELIQKALGKLTTQEKYLLTLIQKLAKTKAGAEITEREVQTMTNEIVQRTASKSHYTSLADEVWESTKKEIQDKIDKGEVIKQDDVIKLFKEKMSTLTTTKGEVIDPKVIDALSQKISNKQDFKDLVTEIPKEIKEVTRMGDDGIIDKLSEDIADEYYRILEKGNTITEEERTFIEMVNQWKSKTKDYNSNDFYFQYNKIKRTERTDELFTEENKLVFEGAKKPYNVTESDTLESIAKNNPPATVDDLIQLNPEIAKRLANNEPPLKVGEKIFLSSGIRKVDWSDTAIWFVDLFTGKYCSRYICKRWFAFLNMTGGAVFVDIVTRAIKRLRDVIKLGKNSLSNFNYATSEGRIIPGSQELSSFQQQYMESINRMQAIATKQDSGWQMELEREKDFLYRLVDTRVQNQEMIKNVGKSKEIIQDMEEEIELELKNFNKKDFPGVVSLIKWIDDKKKTGENIFTILQELVDEWTRANGAKQKWMIEITPFMREGEKLVDDVTISASKAEKDGVIDAIEKNITEQGNKLKETPVTPTGYIKFFGSTIWDQLKSIFKWAGEQTKKFFKEKISNLVKTGLMTNLSSFKQVLLRHGYGYKGLITLYIKMVFHVAFLKLFFITYQFFLTAILSSLSGLIGVEWAQEVLLFFTTPINFIKVKIGGNQKAQKALYEKLDDLNAIKENFWGEFFDRVLSVDTIKVIPWIENIANFLGGIADIILSFTTDDKIRFNEDISIIGSEYFRIPFWIADLIRGINAYKNKENPVLDAEKGLQEKLQENIDQMQSLLKTDIKKALGEDYVKKIEILKKRELENLMPGFRGGCYDDTITKLIQNFYDLNPKYQKPITETNLGDQANPKYKDDLDKLRKKIDDFGGNTASYDTDSFKANYWDIFGVVYKGKFHMIQQGPFLIGQKGRIDIGGGSVPQGIIGYNDIKCCGMYGYYISTDETGSQWYCVADKKLYNAIFGGKSEIEKGVTNANDVKSKEIFDKIKKGVEIIEKKIDDVQVNLQTINYWVETYNEASKNPLRNKELIKGCQIQLSNLGKSYLKIYRDAKNYEKNVNNILIQTYKINNPEIIADRNAFIEDMKQNAGIVKFNEDMSLNFDPGFPTYKEVYEILNQVPDTTGQLGENFKIKTNNYRITNKRYLLENRNMRSRYIFENEDEQRFGENKFDHWYDTFTFQKYDEKSGDFKDIETDSLKHGKIKERFNDFIKNYDGDDAFVRAVVDTHPEVSRFKYLKDQANIQEAYYPTGLASILSVIRESKGEYEIFSVSRQKGGNWNLVKGDFTQKEMSNMVLTKQIPPEKKPKERENGLESLKKKEATGTNSLRNDEKEGLKNLPKKVKEKVQEKISRGWTTEIPPKIFKDFYEESEVSSVFNEKIPIYKLEATPEFFRSLQKNSSHVLVRRGFCRSLLIAKNDSDINSEQRKVVNHILSKCGDKFEGKLGLRYLSKKN